MLRFLKTYREVVIWNGALLLMAIMDIDKAVSLCLLKTAGFSWCPGCGLGHAIHHALHFNFEQSFHEHILGIPATMILFYQSCKSIYTINKIKYHEPTTAIKGIS